MDIRQMKYMDGKWESNLTSKNKLSSKELLFLFLDRIQLEENTEIFHSLKSECPNSDIVICSTSGNITNETTIKDDPIATGISFDSSNYQIEKFDIYQYESGIELGQTVLKKFDNKDLKHLMVLGVGNDLNGSELVEGMNAFLQSENLTISGGLAGDDTRFERTIVGVNGNYDSNSVVIIGFWGEKLNIETTSRGGWESFGPIREVTKSNKNILYEIDNKNALDLYKEYLGEFAAELPQSALFFPLEVKRKGEKEGLVRTILSIDEDKGRMIFAGDIPEESQIRLMKASKDKIILSAGISVEELRSKNPELLLLISCVGRRIVLGNRTEEEIEEIRHIINNEATIFGFYSYGEISMNGIMSCELYNQTMTITSFQELS